MAIRNRARRPRPRAVAVFRWLGRMRVGTRVVLLLLVPMSALLVVTGIANFHGIARSRDLEQFQRRANASFIVSDIAGTVANERTLTVRNHLEAADAAALRAEQERVDRRIAEASRGAVVAGDADDLNGRLNAVRRQLFALRLRAEAMTTADIEQGYAQIIETLEAIERDLTALPPTRDVATAAFADLTMRSALEAARREQLDVWLLLRTTSRGASSSRWPALEQAALNAYRTAAPSDDAAELNAALFSPPGLYVRTTRARLARSEVRGEVGEASRWWTQSAARLRMLERIRERSRRSVGASVDADLHSARSGVWAMLALSAAVVLTVLALGLLLRRSIARSLEHLSSSARALSAGDLSAPIPTDGRDEIAEVGQALAAVRTTNRQLVREIHSLNAAIAAKDLTHAPNPAAFHGAWADVLDGLNATMTEVAQLHGTTQHEVDRQKAFNVVGRQIVGGLEIDQAYRQCCELLIAHVGALRAEIYDRTGHGWTRRIIAGVSAPPWPPDHAFNFRGTHPTCRPDASIAVVRSIAELHDEPAAALAAEFADDKPLDAADALFVEGVVRLLDEASHRRQQEQAQLRTQTLEATGTMAAAVAHDFNNVLGAILNNARLGVLETKDEQAAATFEAISSAVGRASDIVNRLLSFARSEPPARSQFELTELLTEVCTLLRPGLPREIELTYDRGRPLMLTGDPTRIHQVIVNLITNSAHALAETPGAQITITVDELVLTGHATPEAERLAPGTYVRIRVHDNGPGIPDAVARRVFDPFFTTKPKGEGTGLGLAAALTIARDHHGTLTLESPPSGGTTATLYLPSEAGG